MPTTPDFLFIDTILLAYRLGHIRHEEQKASMLAAARAATDAFSYLRALESFGVGKQTELYRFAGQVLAAPAHFRAQYPMILGLRKQGEKAQPFLNNLQVLALVEGVLTRKQQSLFYDNYWWFVHNHQPVVADPKQGHSIGVYATEPQDNASTLQRFEDYLLRLQKHKNLKIREQYERFPVDIVVAILRRTFVNEQ